MWSGWVGDDDARTGRPSGGEHGPRLARLPKLQSTIAAPRHLRSSSHRLMWSSANGRHADPAQAGGDLDRVPGGGAVEGYSRTVGWGLAGGPLRGGHVQRADRRARTALTPSGRSGNGIETLTVNELGWHNYTRRDTKMRPELPQFPSATAATPSACAPASPCSRQCGPDRRRDSGGRAAWWLHRIHLPFKAGRSPSSTASSTVGWSAMIADSAPGCGNTLTSADTSVLTVETKLNLAVNYADGERLVARGEVVAGAHADHGQGRGLRHPRRRPVDRCADGQTIGRHARQGARRLKACSENLPGRSVPEPSLESEWMPMSVRPRRQRHRRLEHVRVLPPVRRLAGRGPGFQGSPTNRQPAGAYGAADGRLLYAEVDGKPAGCVGIRRHRGACG